MIFVGNATTEEEDYRIGSDDKARVLKIIRLLEGVHPDAKIALHFSNSLELLVATMLSAQCTDERVNEVAKSLFKKYQRAEDYAKADLKELEKDIRPTGFTITRLRTLRQPAKYW